MEKLTKFLTAANTYIAVFGITGIASLEYGIFLLLGEGAAAIALGVIMIALTNILLRNSNG